MDNDIYDKFFSSRSCHIKKLIIKNANFSLFNLSVLMFGLSNNTRLKELVVSSNEF